EISLGADDRVIHPVVAAEIADVAEAGVDAHAHAEGLLDAALAPLHVELGEAALHVQGHRQARLCVLDRPRDSGSPKNTRIASPMNLLTVPPCAAAIDDISVRYSLSSAVSSSGCIRSAVAVKSTTSEKKTVSFLRSVAISTSLPAKMPR